MPERDLKQFQRTTTPQPPSVVVKAFVDPRGLPIAGGDHEDTHDFLESKANISWRR